MTISLDIRERTLTMGVRANPLAQFVFADARIGCLEGFFSGVGFPVIEIEIANGGLEGRVEIGHREEPHLRIKNDYTPIKTIRNSA